MISLEGKTALITGGSMGLGLEIARAYVGAGASVYLCARGPTALVSAITELERSAPAGYSGRIAGELCNVAYPDALRGLVLSVLAHCGHIDILVNNAGIHGPKGRLEKADWNAWYGAIATNLLGPAYLCRALIPHMIARGNGKIINISGGGATKPLYGLSAYATSKAALVRLTECLALELAGTGIDVNAVAPGALNTRLLDDVLEAGPEKVGEVAYENAVARKVNGGQPIGRAADLCVFLASDQSDGITGRLIAAQWDFWLSLPERKAEVAATDVYTLRRVEAKDRGKNWD